VEREVRSAESDPIRQHWITKGVSLRRFATPETASSRKPRTWCGDLHEGRVFQLSIKRAAAENYLYSPVADDGSRDFTTETKLSRLEGVIGHLWSMFDVGYPDLSDEAVRKATALYVSTLYLRNPARLSDQQLIHQQIVHLYQRAQALVGPRPIMEIMRRGKWIELTNDSDWKDYRSADREKLKHVFVKVLRSSARKIATLLLARTWAIVCADEPAFVIADDPVVLVNDSRERFGFGTPGTLVVMPINPTRLLIISEGLPGDYMYYRLRPAGAAEVNALSVANATRFIFSAVRPERVGVAVE
jgi:hypothetical protein